MAPRIMTPKPPKGLLVLSLYIFITGILSIRYFFQPIQYVIFFNIILTGIIFQIWNSFNVILSIAIGAGLCFRKKWAYILFLSYQIAGVVLLASNIFLIEKATLLEASWKESAKYDLVFLFKTFTVVLICFQIALVLWANRYKGLFNENQQKP